MESQTLAGKTHEHTHTNTRRHQLIYHKKPTLQDVLRGIKGKLHLTLQEEEEEEEEEEEGDHRVQASMSKEQHKKTFTHKRSKVEDVIEAPRTDETYGCCGVREMREMSGDEGDASLESPF